MALDKPIVPCYLLNVYCYDVLPPFCPCLHPTRLDLSWVTPRLGSFRSRHCAQDTAHIMVGDIPILGWHFQVARRGGNGSEEYAHSWLVGPKLITRYGWYLLLSSVILEICSEP